MFNTVQPRVSRNISAQITIRYSCITNGKLTSAGDTPEGRKLLKTLENSGWEEAHVIMDKAYDGDETRQLVLALEMLPVVLPPKSNRLTPWEYDKEMYKKRNQVERLFRRLKSFRRIFSRSDKLDVVFMFFIHFALITDAIFSVNTP